MPTTAEWIRQTVEQYFKNNQSELASP